MLSKTRVGWHASCEEPLLKGNEQRKKLFPARHGRQGSTGVPGHLWVWDASHKRNGININMGLIP
jgi:hypothetical protein